MNRHNLPATAAAPDIPLRMTEIRAPERSTGHETRSREEVRA